jgi:capsular polysaccharide transport system permease protein
MRSLTRTLLFVLIFVLPLAAVAVYEAFLVTDRYHSDSSIIITQEQSQAPSLDLSVLGLPTSSTSKDALVVQEFVLSVDMLKYLDETLRLRAHYSQASIDWLSRLAPDASLEDFHNYMLRYLTVEFDTESQIIRMHVEAFDRDFAQAVLNAVLARSQDFVDRLNARVTADQTQFFEKQLVNSERRLKEVKEELLKFQQENRLLTTESEASLVMANIAALEKQLIDKRAELEVRKRELAETAPAIVNLKSEIASIEEQIRREKDRLSGGAGGSLNELDAQYRAILLNMEFVTNIYKSNLTLLEQARMEAIRRLKFLVVVTQPSLADASEFPDRLFIVGTAAMVLLMLYFILALIVAIVREHS